MNKLQSTLALLLAGNFLLSGCKQQTEYPPQPQTKVEIFEVGQQNQQQLRSFSAVIRAHELVPLSFRVSGELNSLPITARKVIAKGEILASLENSDFKRRLNEAQAALTLAEKNYSRAKTLLPQEAISQSEHDTLKAHYEIAYASFRQARQALSYTQITAYEDSIISEIHVENFESVQPGKAIVSLHSKDYLLVEVQVPEKLIATGNRAALQQEYTVKVEELGGQTFKARYFEHQTEMDKDTNSYLFTLIMPKTTGNLILPGMSATVDANLQQSQAFSSTSIAIPNEAVFYDNSEELSSAATYVWLYDQAQQTVSKRFVKTASLNHSGILITSGLNFGEQVVIAGGRALFEGQQVQIKQQSMAGVNN
jgi:RND family efflux transporter MFP subunit